MFNLFFGKTTKTVNSSQNRNNSTDYEISPEIRKKLEELELLKHDSYGRIFDL
jgi:hypothetical protein